jgi:hypothetical protein
MSEHTGFFHDPTSDINAIREMLDERYHLGLPVIKELIQNGDDAKAQLIPYKHYEKGNEE